MHMSLASAARLVCATYMAGIIIAMYNVLDKCVSNDYVL